MNQSSPASDLKIEEFLKTQDTKGLLRFITCGSVDDGKSTLIGRLLYESKLIYEDQLHALTADSKKFGTVEQGLDLALLVDGLAAEREQGITIDVAYRFFSTHKRKFIVADTPGHEQYTRNMATGASTADLAIVIVDARKGILTQTRRHSFIVSMLGIKHIILAVNKMDLIDYQQEVFQGIVEEYTHIAHLLDVKSVQTIPVSALHGDNIVAPSPHMPWYDGQTLMDCLETIPLKGEDINKPFRMPVQWVNRPHLDFRGYSGTIASGQVHIGDRVKIIPSGKESVIKKIVSYDGDLQNAALDDSITLVLKDEIDVSRGDIIVCSKNPIKSGEQFEAHILWMSETELIPGRQYLLQSHTAQALCAVRKPKYRVDINTYQHIASKTLCLNEIGVCDIVLNKKIPMEPYKDNRNLGAFILIDKITHETVAAGMIHHVLHRSINIHKQQLNLDQEARSLIKGQKPCVIWLTGLSGAGKSTIANIIEEQLYHLNKHTMILDGDNLRHGLNNDLGFTIQDRVENIRRIAEVSKLMIEAGLITLVSTISPFQAERKMAKDLIGSDKFIEVFVDAPLEEAERRDPKGLYKKARAGEIPNFTGISSAYEVPQAPDLYLNTLNHSAEELAAQIIHYLSLRNII